MRNNAINIIGLFVLVVLGICILSAVSLLLIPTELITPSTEEMPADISPAFPQVENQSGLIGIFGILVAILAIPGLFILLEIIDPEGGLPDLVVWLMSGQKSDD